MPRVRTDFPRQVEVHDHVLIPMRDGIRLAARIWLPIDARSNPVPAVLEYIPYRKSDGTSARDALIHPYVAGHGFASVRVDTRGSGASEGTLDDEYLPQELEDGCEIIAWLAAQPWCTGRVGMIGKSWGGFNALQIAALRPAELAGIVTVCSTDDRYADDVHYMGGTVLASKMLAWASTMLAANGLPPDPEDVGDCWRDLWFQRLEANDPWVETWLAHQRRDHYWQHGSVCEEYSSIRCPVYAIGGWADGYSNAVLRLLEGLSVPRKGLIGPWGHQYPESGVPGPAIGFLQELVRWWDYWLKDVDNGIMDEPTLRVWMQDWVRPDQIHEFRPGRWVAEDSWPPPTTKTVTWWLQPDRLSPTVIDHRQPIVIHDTTLVGVDGGDWCPAGSPSDLPHDQRGEDGRSRCFDSAPLDDDLPLLGFPEVVLDLSSDQPQANIAVRLCDVAPDGTSLLVTRGVLNLSHRDSHASPAPLEPGQTYTVRIRMNAIAQTIPAGHRLRLAISTTYWPWIWPAPADPELTLHPVPNSVLSVPTRPDRASDDSLPEFETPEVARPLDVQTRQAGGNDRVISRDIGTGRIEVTRTSDEEKYLSDRRLYKSRHRVESCVIHDGDPLSCTATSDVTQCLERGEWRIRVETSSVMTADESFFRGSNTVRAYEGYTCVFTNSRSFQIPRDLC